MVSAAQVEEAFEALSEVEGDDVWCDYYWSTYDRDQKKYVSASRTIEVDGEALPVVFVEGTGGMAQGSHATSVFKVGDQYFRKEGYYASHYGYDWDGDFREVKQVEETITVFKPV